MATTYIPLTIKVTGTTASVGQYFDDGIPRFFVYMALNTSAGGAQVALNNMTALPLCVQCHYGNNQVYLAYTGSTSVIPTLYYSVAIVFPYFAYSPSAGSSLTALTSSSGALTVYATTVTNIDGPGRLVGKDVLTFFDENFYSPKNLHASATTIVTASAGKPYATRDYSEDCTYLIDLETSNDKEYTPLNGLQWMASNNGFVYEIPTYNLYWSGTSITVYNQSVSSALSISTFDVTATTTANTTVSIFHLASSQSVGAGGYKSVTVTHAASNPVVAVSSVTLTLACSGPAGWNGPISVKDSKSLFNETSTSSRNLTATKYITANTSGGTVSVYMRPPTRTITAGTGISLKATNTTSMNIILMYLEIWAEDVTNGMSYQEIMSVTGNPTIAAGASNVVLGKLISKTSYGGQHLRITVQGYSTYAPNPVTFQASGSTGQNFGVHSISGIDPANFDETIEWDASGNVVLTGGTIMFKFS